MASDTEIKIGPLLLGVRSDLDGGANVLVRIRIADGMRTIGQVTMPREDWSALRQWPEALEDRTRQCHTSIEQCNGYFNGGPAVETTRAKLARAENALRAIAAVFEFPF